MKVQWYDWITPTTPGAALFFGIVFTLIVAIMLKWKMKSWDRGVITIGQWIELAGIL